VCNLATHVIVVVQPSLVVVVVVVVVVVTLATMETSIASNVFFFNTHQVIYLKLTNTYYLY
jgi:hypothetical protein